MGIALRRSLMAWRHCPEFRGMPTVFRVLLFSSLRAAPVPAPSLSCCLEGSRLFLLLVFGSVGFPGRWHGVVSPCVCVPTTDTSSVSAAPCAFHALCVTTTVTFECDRPSWAFLPFSFFSLFLFPSFLSSFSHFSVLLNSEALCPASTGFGCRCTPQWSLNSAPPGCPCLGPGRAGGFCGGRHVDGWPAGQKKKITTLKTLTTKTQQRC